MNKKLIYGILLFFLFNMNAHVFANSLTTVTMKHSFRIYDDSLIKHNKALKLTKMAHAFAYVESGNNPKAFNKSGNCVGWLQITPGCVKAANTVIGFKCFTLEDRWDKYHSYAMFKVLMDKYNPSYDLYKACKIWNPTAGSYYYNKVKHAYDNHVSHDLTLDSAACQIVKK